MSNKEVSGLPTIPVVDRAADLLYIVDTSAGTSNNVTPNVLLGITGAPVGDTDTATLSAKTLTNPTINGATLSGTLSGTYTIGGTPTFPANILTTTNSVTVSGKTLTSPTINTATIVNPTITTDAISEYTAANGVTIDGLNIKDGKLNTNNSVITASITDASVTNAKLSTTVGDIGGAWKGWTPTLTNFAGTVVAARYTLHGKMCHFYLEVTQGASVTGRHIFSLPVTAHASIVSTIGWGAPIARGGILDLGTQMYDAFGGILTSTTCGVGYTSVVGALIAHAPTSATAPMTWANGNDKFWLYGSYEIA